MPRGLRRCRRSPNCRLPLLPQRWSRLGSSRAREAGRAQGNCQPGGQGGARSAGPQHRRNRPLNPRTPKKPPGTGVVDLVEVVFDAAWNGDQEQPGGLAFWPRTGAGGRGTGNATGKPPGRPSWVARRSVVRGQTLTEIGVSGPSGEGLGCLTLKPHWPDASCRTRFGEFRLESLVYCTAGVLPKQAMLPPT
jgi:hypothetical protein